VSVGTTDTGAILVRLVPNGAGWLVAGVEPTQQPPAAASSPGSGG
jgi:hypothetical protein